MTTTDDEMVSGKLLESGGEELDRYRKLENGQLIDQQDLVGLLQETQLEQSPACLECAVSLGILDRRCTADDRFGEPPALVRVSHEVLKD